MGGLRSFGAFGVLGFVVALAGCDGILSIGSEELTTAASDAGGSPSLDGGERDANQDATAVIGVDAGTIGNVGTVLCEYGMPDGGVPPGKASATYGRGCAVPSDCAIGNHMNDCCGSMVALGVRAN